MEGQERLACFLSLANAGAHLIRLSLRLWWMDPYSRTWNKSQKSWDDILSNASEYLLQRPCDEEVRNRIQDSIEVHDDLPSQGEGAENQMSQRTRKSTIRLVRPAKTQISLRIRAVWSESSLLL